MKVSFIATVLNEETTIDRFISSLLSQSRKCDEIIIIDGGSTDNTYDKLKKYKRDIKVYKIVGNRSIGRNAAIKNARYSLIAISDSGCILDKNWCENIIRPFLDRTISVVSGYYKAKTTNVFQKALVPYVFVMPDKIRQSDFLPSSRSMAIRKSVWQKLGGFPEQYSHNEDYVFAKTLKKKSEKIVFQKNAISYWIPRKNIHEAFIMFFRFAYGDIESGIYRPKVLILIMRMYIGLILFVLGVFVNSLYLQILFILVVLYFLWAIFKNYRYVRSFLAFLYLPLLQITSDIAIFLGSHAGYAKSFFKKL